MDDLNELGKVSATETDLAICILQFSIFNPTPPFTAPSKLEFGVPRLPAEQAEGLPDSIRWLSAVTPPDRNRKCPADPEGVTDLWHPSRMPRTTTPLPGVSAAL